MTDSGSSRERIEEKGLEIKYKLPTPYLLFSIKLIFSNGSCRSRLGGNIYSYHNAAYTHRAVTGRAEEREKRGATSINER